MDRRAFLNASGAIAAALSLAAFVPGSNAQEGEPRPPFVTTPQAVVERMLVLAGTSADDFVMDLGSGDGRIVILAARQFGARGLGIEIDPELVARSRENARLAGMAGLAAFEERDVLDADLSRATVVTIYLLPWLVDRLQPKLMQELRPGTRIVAHAFAMKGWKPDRTELVRVAQPERGQSGESALYLWTVPAEARGLWHAAGWQLRVTQNYQEIEIEASYAGAPVVVQQARLDGRAIRFYGPEVAFRGRVEDGVMRGELTRQGRTEGINFRKDGT